MYLGPNLITIFLNILWFIKLLFYYVVYFFTCFSIIILIF